jgi:hypothetical protein
MRVPADAEVVERLAGSKGDGSRFLFRQGAPALINSAWA